MCTGRRVWDAVLPFTEESQVWPGVFSGNPYQFLENTMNLAFVQVPGVLIAIDGLTGDAKWQWPIPADHSLQGVSGWDDGLGIIMQGQPVTSPYFPAVIRPTVLASLNASDGSVFWLQNATTALPLSQADAASYAVESIEGTKGGLLYSRANKLLLIDWVDGSIIWQTQVSLEGSVGTGQGANVTHVRYIPKHPLSDKPERILLNANNWGFQRFVMMAFNETNTTGTCLYRSYYTVHSAMLMSCATLL
jgi:outer membrane protein assembly factor BamB